MTQNRKKRLSMLDSLAAAGGPAPSTTAPTPSMMTANRALRSARDAVDGHNVWELDPRTIDDTRLTDRLDPLDIYDLRDAIEANGQTVPILVRRHPTEPDRYLLVYGRRRLEAIRQSDKVEKVRALVATLDDTAAVRAQISENMARRDLSYIEKALFARELIEVGFGTQSQVAEVLTVAKSAISMALAIVDTVTPDLARAIGPAHGVGRPRWDTLAKAIEATDLSPDHLIRLAEDAHSRAVTDMVTGADTQTDPSQAAFDTVLAEVARGDAKPKPQKSKDKPKVRSLHAAGQRLGTLRKSAQGLRLDIDDGSFADWLEHRADSVLEELHSRWQRRGED